MASIRKIQQRYHVQIRKKNISICASFNDRDTAILWSKYKEDLIDQIIQFDVPMNELMTLNDALDLKLKDMIEKRLDTRDIKIIRNDFQEFLNIPIKNIKYEDYLEKMKKMSKQIVKIGGTLDRQETGIKKIQSPKTIIRKMALLSSTYSLLIGMGIDLENSALRAMQYLRKKIKEEKK
jgi:hypothetical protein